MVALVFLLLDKLEVRGGSLTDLKSPILDGFAGPGLVIINDVSYLAPISRAFD